MPSIDQALQQLVEGREGNEKHLREMGVSRAEIDALFERLIAMNGNFRMEQVVCHGDYHCLNLLPASGDLVVLDWEFIQINSVYWDFYTLLDMATPRYRINVDKGIRMDVLNAYINKRSEAGWVPPVHFIPHYHLYSLIYSVGILALVSEDLAKGRFDRETLLIEKQEVTSIIRDCLDVVFPAVYP
jgi:thiamine kinase-like enzyme